MSSHGVALWEQKCQPRKLFDLKIWNSLTWCSESNRALSAQVECRNGAIDPGSSRNRRSTWIQTCGKHNPSSPKPREIDDILQLASIEAKCTTETECRFKKDCCLKLPLAESCLWRATKNGGSKVAFPVSRTNAEFPVGWSNWDFWPGNQYRLFRSGNQSRVSFGVGTYVEVWGVAQRRRCLRGILSLHAEMLVSPNATNEAA